MPVKVITGCSASGSAPTRVAGSSTLVPNRPVACTTNWPGVTAPVSARPATSPPSTSSGTVSSTRSLASITCAVDLSGMPGRSASTRRRESSETAYAATSG